MERSIGRVGPCSLAAMLKMGWRIVAVSQNAQRMLDAFGLGCKLVHVLPELPGARAFGRRAACRRLHQCHT